MSDNYIVDKARNSGFNSSKPAKIEGYSVSGRKPDVPDDYAPGMTITQTEPGKPTTFTSGQVPQRTSVEQRVAAGLEAARKATLTYLGRMPTEARVESYTKAERNPDGWDGRGRRKLKK